MTTTSRLHHVKLALAILTIFALNKQCLTSTTSSPEELNTNTTSSPEELDTNATSSPEQLNTDTTELSEQLNTITTSSPEELTTSMTSSPEQLNTDATELSEQLNTITTSSPEELTSPEQLNTDTTELSEQLNTSTTSSPEELTTSMTSSPEQLNTDTTELSEQLNTITTSSPEELTTSMTSSPEQLNTDATDQPEQFNTITTSSPEQLNTDTTDQPEQLTTSMTSSLEQLTTRTTSSPEQLTTSATSSPEQLNTNTTSAIQYLTTNPTSSPQQLATNTTSSQQHLTTSMTSSQQQLTTNTTSLSQLQTTSSGIIKTTTFKPTTTSRAQSSWCSKAPCLNNGLCQINQCKCSSGFKGLLCETNIDDCVSNGASVCKNGAYCVDKVNDFSCTCLKGFTGKDCSTVIDECATIANTADQCPIDSDCQNVPGSHKCNCKAGLTGKNCVLLALDPENNKELEKTWTTPGIFLAKDISIGSTSWDFLRISQYGFVSLGNNINWWSSKPPVYYINNFNTIGPLIYPYWYNFDYISSLNGSIFYQELTKPTNDSLQFKTIDKMIKRLTGNQKYASSYNFVVNWNLIEPWNYYRYFYFWYPYYTNYEFYNQHTEPATFQLIISTDGSYYYAVFNYEDFNFKDFRTGDNYFSSWWNNPASGIMFSNGSTLDIQDITIYNSNNFAWNPQTAPGNVIKTSGMPTKGRYGITLSTPQEINFKKQCKNWIDVNEEGPKNTKIEKCDNCPATFAQAVIDRRYNAIDVSCDGDASKVDKIHMTMCFEGPSISAEFEMRTVNARYCNWRFCYSYSYTYRHTLKWIVPRCCYKTSINMNKLKDEFYAWYIRYSLTNYCNSQYGDGIRWALRWSGFTIDGTFIDRYSNGAIPPLVYYPDDTNYWLASKDTMFAFQTCKSARILNKLESVRPTCTTENYNFNEAVTRGDPHITTMDGNFYTFNGLCEFIMIKSVGSVSYLLVQSRTELASSKNPQAKSKATVFTGFAIASLMQDKPLVVLLNRNQSEISIYYENVLRTTLSDLIGKNASTYDHFNVLAVNNSTLTISVPSTGFVMEVKKTLDFLQASFQLDDVYKNSITGLMGNFNQNKNDDFVMRNGTRISENSTEREIFQFGLTWRVFENESLFYYENGTQPSEFCDLSFEPVFTDDFRDPDKLLALFNNNTDLLSSANNTCQNSIEALYLSCMYDASQMQSLDAAKESKSSSDSDQQTRVIAGNRPPKVNMPNSINLTVKQDFHINLDFNDTEDITFEVKLYEVVDRNGSVNVGSEINNTFVAIQGNTLVWSNISNNSMVMRVIATDSSGASSDWQPIVLLCHCLNGGSCSYEKMVSNNASDSFYKAFCNCVNKYSGESCEISPCNSNPNPCFNASQCSVLMNGSISCGVCPEGKVGNAFGLNGCQDVDECFNNPRLCQDKCVNLDPGYRCVCTQKGFQVDARNLSACIDIDECASSSNNSCDESQNQTCVNTIGSYDCVCPSGSKYINITGSCVDVNECTLNQYTCRVDSVCVNMENSGYLCLCQPPFIEDLNGTCVQLPMSAQPTPAPQTPAPQTPKPAVVKVFEMRSTIKKNGMDLEYTTDLENKESPRYKEMFNVAETMLRESFKLIEATKNAGLKITDITFFQGSIKFTAKFTFDVKISLTDTQLATSLSSVKLTGEFSLANLEISSVDDVCSVMASTACHPNATCANSFGSYNCTCNKGYKDISSPKPQGSMCQLEKESGSKMALALGLGLGLGLGLFVLLVVVLLLIFWSKGWFKANRRSVKRVDDDGYTDQIPHVKEISKSNVDA